MDKSLGRLSKDPILSSFTMASTRYPSSSETEKLKTEVKSKLSQFTAKRYYFSLRKDRN